MINLLHGSAHVQEKTYTAIYSKATVYLTVCLIPVVKANEYVPEF